jgi:hypothetical protein
MPGGEITGGLDPLNKSTLSAEVKSSHIYPKNGVDVPERTELLPESDRVQLTKELQSIHSQSLTSNSELNQYLQIMRQSEAEGLLDAPIESASVQQETRTTTASSAENFNYYA